MKIKTRKSQMREMAAVLLVIAVIAAMCYAKYKSIQKAEQRRYEELRAKRRAEKSARYADLDDE